MPFNTRTGGQQDVAQQGYTELRVLKGERRGKFFKNPISKFNVLLPGTTGSVEITFAIAFTRGVQNIQILRGINANSADPGAALILQTYTINALENPSFKLNVLVSYPYTNPFMSGKTFKFWLRIYPLHSNFQPLLAGPVSVLVT